ncbi:MAG: phosphoglycerate mutase family protein [Acidobacteriota bacterium]
MRNGWWLSVLLLLLALPCLTAGAGEGLPTLYLVRHADKVDFWPADRALNRFWPLSRPGTDRADALAERLEDAGIAAIYTSSTTRTLATGMPLAEATDIPISPDDRTIEQPQLADFFADLKSRHRDDAAVLVVGHSDTVPHILIELGAAPSCFERLDINDHDGQLLIHGYEGLWRIDLNEAGCHGIERQIVSLPAADGDGE